jgi:hypothetical protein
VKPFITFAKIWKAMKVRRSENLKSDFLSPDRTHEERALGTQQLNNLQMKEKIKSDPAYYLSITSPRKGL